MSESSTYAADKEKNKDLEVGKSEATTVDLDDEAIQTSPPNTGNDEEVPKETEADPFDVWWDEPADQDPANPMNWPMSRKWATIAVLSAITFLTLVFLNRRI